MTVFVWKISTQAHQKEENGKKQVFALEKEQSAQFSLAQRTMKISFETFCCARIPLNLSNASD